MRPPNTTNLRIVVVRRFLNRDVGKVDVRVRGGVGVVSVATDQQRATPRRQPDERTRQISQTRVPNKRGFVATTYDAEKRANPLR